MCDIFAILLVYITLYDLLSRVHNNAIIIIIELFIISIQTLAYSQKKVYQTVYRIVVLPTLQFPWICLQYSVK